MSKFPDDFIKRLRDSGLEDAAKKVRFPWGFSIVEIDGQKVLQGLTPKEYRSFIKRNSGRDIPEQELDVSRCFGAGGSCHSQGCPGICIAVQEHNTVVCECHG